MSVLVRTGECRYRYEHPVVRNVKDGSILVWVPGGEFEMGDGEVSDRPKHRVWVDGYYIGVYCVTNVQYGRYVREGGGREPADRKWEDPSLAGHPVVGVSWDDAMGYAKWAGCELPTEAQWERAARGPRSLIYPWGAEWDAGRCRHRGNRGSEETSEVWGYGKGVSGYGTYQQSGNVWEWCRDRYGRDYYRESGAGRNPEGPSGVDSRVIRCGGWRNVDPSYFRGSYRDWLAPSYRGDVLGFRLVRTV